MIVLDLEWNRGYDKTPLEEILQIGAVRLDRVGGKITDTFNAYIKPCVHKKLDPPARVLPELEASKRSGLDFPTAMAAFRRWCGTETVFATWGGGDVAVLNENCKHWKLPGFAVETVYDFQAAFSLLLGTGQQIALSRAVEYCRIPEVFVYHNALNDAVYTAAVGERMGERALVLEKPPRIVRQFTAVQYPPQPRKRVGPFQTVEAALNSLSSRRPACPVCGKTAWVLQWRSIDPMQHYACVTCPEHGRFPCRLTLGPGEHGEWKGRLSVPAITPEFLQAFMQASKGKLHTCKGGSRRRKRRRWPRRQAVAG